MAGGTFRAMAARTRGQGLGGSCVTWRCHLGVEIEDTLPSMLTQVRSPHRNRAGRPACLGDWGLRVAAAYPPLSASTGSAREALLVGPHIANTDVATRRIGASE